MFRYAVTDNVITEDNISKSVCSESEHNLRLELSELYYDFVYQKLLYSSDNSNSILCSLHNILV